MERFESICFRVAAVGTVAGSLVLVAGILLGSADVVLVGVFGWGAGLVAATLLG